MVAEQLISRVEWQANRIRSLVRSDSKDEAINAAFRAAHRIPLIVNRKRPASFGVEHVAGKIINMQRWQIFLAEGLPPHAL